MYKTYLSFLVISLISACSLPTDDTIPNLVDAIFTCDPDGGNLINYYDTFATYVQIIPNSNKLLYQNGDDLMIYNIENENSYAIVDTLDVYSSGNTLHTLNNTGEIVSFAAIDDSYYYEVFMYNINNELVFKVSHANDTHSIRPSFANTCNDIVYLQADGDSRLNHYKLLIYDFEDETTTVLLEAESGDKIHNPIFSHDDSKIYFIYNLSSEVFLYEYNLISDELSELISNVTVSYNLLTISDNGILCYRDNSEFIHIYNTNNSIDKTIVEGFYPCISPDGSYIAYQSSNVYASIYSYNIQNDQIHSIFGYGGYPLFSWDSMKISFSGMYDSNQ